MGLRMRKSIKLGPGVRLNVSHKSVGLRVGGRGAGVSVNSSGRHSASVGIPGSGVGYSTRLGGSGGSRARAAAIAPSPPPKPGLMASGTEKAFYKAIAAVAAGQHQEALRLFRASNAKDSKDKALADDFFVGLLSAQLAEDEAAIAALEKVVDSDRALPDALMEKYLDGGGTVLAITEHVAVQVPFGSACAALVLAEVYQRNGRLEEAIGVVQQLVDVHPHPYLVLSLCDLLAAAGAYDELVLVAAGVSNQDDVSCQIRILQADALAKQGMRDAALEAYKDALRSKKREPGLLKDARYARALLHLDSGKKALARKELEKLYAEDPRYRDVADRIRALTPAN